MSSKLFPYLLKNNQWIKSEAISSDDVAVLVDTTRDIIWYLEGEKSSARTKFDARGLLGQLKIKYIAYKFKRIDNRAPKDVLDKIEELKRTEGIKLRINEIQKFSKYLYSLNIIAGVIQIIGMIFITWALFWSQAYDSQFFLNYIVNSNHFDFYIDLVSILILSSMIIFIFTSFFGIILRKKSFVIISIILAVTSYFSLAYIRLGSTSLFLWPTTPFPNVMIRVDAFLFFILGVDIILFTNIVSAIIPEIYWLIKRV